MNLVLDIGNTRTKAAVFYANKLVCDQTFTGKVTLKRLQNFLEKKSISSAILCSVIHHPKAINTFLNTNYFFIELTEKTKLSVKNRYQTPKTLGKDRLANAAGANALFPGENVLSIDAGTCIKYDFVNAKNEYLGGAISPGITMRFKALHSFTAKLPLLQKSRTKQPIFIGKNTRESIHSGVQYGVMAEVKGIIRLYQEKYKKLIVVFTGGDAAFLNINVSEKNRIFTVPDLTLLGLNAILNCNNPHGLL